MMIVPFVNLLGHDFDSDIKRIEYKDTCASDEDLKNKMDKMNVKKKIC